MGTVFGGKRGGRDWREFAAVPPPPRAPTMKPAELARFTPTSPPARAEPDAPVVTSTGRPAGKTFSAEIDVCELDERGRAGQTWSARSSRLSRSSLELRSRRMCHEGRKLLVAVHLIDETPIVLFGTVTRCEYEGDGMHVIDMELATLPDSHEVRAWVQRIT